MKLAELHNTGRICVFLLLLVVMTLSTHAGETPDISGQLLTENPDRPPAPDFEIPDIDGKLRRLSDYRGKVVVLNFWATWCPPCREEMPAMQHAWEQVRNENIVIVAVNIGETADEIFTFTGDYDVDFPLLMDQDSAVVQQWPIQGLPTTYVIDPEGRLVYRAIGGRAWDAPEILDKLRALVKGGRAK